MCNDSELQDRMIYAIEDAFLTIAHRTDMDGGIWWDTLANSTAVELGNILVDLDKYERSDNGHGRRQFYRPKPRA